jgi:lactate racemase
MMVSDNSLSTTTSGEIIGLGSSDRSLSEAEITSVTQIAFETHNLKGQRVLVIIPDGTRTAAIPIFFRLFHEILGPQVAALDYLIALGTHQAMDTDAICRRVGITLEEMNGKYKAHKIYNHRWDLPETFVTLGTITAEETRALSNGMLSIDVPIRVNKLVLDYDILLVCGPVFPHEVVGFSGGNKYFFPGVSGPEVINFTHWLGALLTSYDVIGTMDTPIRAVINRAAAAIPRPKLCFCLVNKQEGLSGLYIGTPEAAWRPAAELSAQIHIRFVDKPFQRALAVMPPLYDDLWTGAKGMYKVEPVIAAGGEVVIYAPRITEISYTHGAVIDEIGYHVRDYFVKQWDRFKNYPWGVMAHSTHVRGIGSFENGIEHPRVQLSLATGIPEARTRKVCLNYIDPASIHPEEWADREDEGILLIPHAGETLYRLK